MIKTPRNFHEDSLEILKTYQAEVDILLKDFHIAMKDADKAVGKLRALGFAVQIHKGTCSDAMVWTFPKVISSFKIN
jgi:hypothetical protein